MSPTADSVPPTVALLTPPGRGAVAVLRVEGPAAAALVGSRFLPASGRPLAEQPLQRLVYGRWGGVAGEEVVVSRLSDHAVEVCCHGGRAAAAAITEVLVRLGCRTMDWQRWLEETEPDPLKAEAAVALAHARTARSAAILLDQHQGALGRQVEAILALLQQEQVAAAAALLDALCGWSDLGLHLCTPWQVVLAGRPNVGKSSLINALVGYQRALVSHQPGTTRDVVTAGTAIDGWPVELADTAGLREAGDPLELAGIELAQARLAQADCLLLVLEATAPLLPEEGELLSRWPHALVVLNKCDLLSAGNLANRAAELPKALRTSALTGEGIDGLLAAMAGRLVPRAPPPGAAIPFTPRQVQALEAACEMLAAGHAPAARDELVRLRRR